MDNIGRNSFDIGYMDVLASGDSFLHRLDPRAKVVATLAFITAVASFDRYAISGLMPFFIFPAVLISAGGLPVWYILKKTLVVAPFAILVGIFNPLLDRTVIMHIGPLGFSAGWISFFSIILRFILTVSAAIILVSLTGFNEVCRALIKFGVPRPFVVQLLFFYRYIFVLTDEAERMVRARSLRTFKRAAMSFGTFISLINHLLLRTLSRAERIYRAMCCRGFDGIIRLIRPMHIGSKEVIYTFFWISLFILFRCVDVSLKLGNITEIFFQ